jgi:hypothetical protein
MSFLAITGAVAIAHAQGERTKRINEALTFNADPLKQTYPKAGF